MASDFQLGMATAAKRLAANLNGSRLQWAGWTFEVTEWESFLADDGAVQARPRSVACLPPHCTFPSLAFTLPVKGWNGLMTTVRRVR